MGGEETSNVTPVALIALLVMMYLTWSLPRRFAICPLLAMTCLMPLGQELDVAGLHFHLFRVLLMVGMVRVFVRHEAAQMQWTRIDRLLIWWVVAAVTFGSLSKPSMELFTNRLGEAYNAIGCYFFIRCVIVDFDDIVTSLRTLALLTLPLAAVMMVERTTRHNPFAVFGGVPELSAIREGHVRCQGAFRHAILAGTFGATQIPLFVALWYYRRTYRPLAVAGMIASMVIVITAASSGALMAVAAGICGLFFWKIHGHMRLVRRGSVALLVVLALVMKAPVWYLFDRISGYVGGGGWHRAYLIDQTVNHFNEWWLFGTVRTAHWGPAGEVIAADQNMMDITNQFVMEGVKGGMLRLILFVAIIVVCFKIVGRWVRAESDEPNRAFMGWALGVSLFAHCTSFMSVPYFDQIIVIWFWVLAVICQLQSIPTPEPAGSGSVDEDHGQWVQNEFAAAEPEVQTHLQCRQPAAGGG